MCPAGAPVTVVLGVDPGSRLLGWGAVRVGASVEALEWGCVRAAGETLPERLASIHVQLAAIIARLSPAEAAVEQVFVARSVDSALKLGHARGVALAALWSGNVAISEYAPRAIKLAVTGSGSASKEQVQVMIRRLLRIDAPIQADAADALAAAVCHGHLRAARRVQDAVAALRPVPRRRGARRWRLPA